MGPNSSVFYRLKGENFKNRGGRQRTVINGRQWSRVEREIGSAASEYACGVPIAAGEGHRRPDRADRAHGVSLQSCGGGRGASKVEILPIFLARPERPATGLNLPQISFNAEATQISKRICRNSGRGQTIERAPLRNSETRETSAYALVYDSVYHKPV